MDVVFRKRKFKLVVTDHAQQRMGVRAITKNLLIQVIENGVSIKKNEVNKYWIYKSFSDRTDNMICVSVSLENQNLVVITTLVNWKPEL